MDRRGVRVDVQRRGRYPPPDPRRGSPARRGASRSERDARRGARAPPVRFQPRDHPRPGGSQRTDAMGQLLVGVWGSIHHERVSERERRVGIAGARGGGRRRGRGVHVQTARPLRRTEVRDRKAVPPRRRDRRGGGRAVHGGWRRGADDGIGRLGAVRDGEESDVDAVGRERGWGGPRGAQVRSRGARVGVAGRGGRGRVLAHDRVRLLQRPRLADGDPVRVDGARRASRRSHARGPEAKIQKRLERDRNRRRVKPRSRVRRRGRGAVRAPARAARRRGAKRHAASRRGVLRQEDRREGRGRGGGCERRVVPKRATGGFVPNGDSRGRRRVRLVRRVRAGTVRPVASARTRRVVPGVGG
mmetsp:Transcript_3993/g.17823  ORF Transcript_3993/g.17823 Transcript_3993/m.17823 type:complete len:359 (-) Transcript_3993:249-1325(-)